MSCFSFHSSLSLSAFIFPILPPSSRFMIIPFQPISSPPLIPRFLFLPYSLLSSFPLIPSSLTPSPNPPGVASVVERDGYDPCLLGRRRMCPPMEGQLHGHLEIDRDVERRRSDRQRHSFRTFHFLPNAIVDSKLSQHGAEQRRKYRGRAFRSQAAI